jgi:6-phosphogluconolactonase (cycloisomerase 2 family)
VADVKMSKKGAFMDISGRGRMSKCLRKRLLWTFPNVADVKMSKKGAFLDISERGRCQNV